MQRARQINAGIQVLVEGNDQRNFFEAFIEHLDLDDVQVQDFGGVDELRGFLSAFVRMPGFLERGQSIGIIRDAEDSSQSAFQSIQSSLSNAGLPVPARLAERVGSNPSIDALVLPGNGRKGMLETLLCESLEDGPIDGCIDIFFECVEALPGSVKRSDKARARTYLATRRRPHLSVGVAAKSGYWNLEHQAFGEVRSFLTRLGRETSEHEGHG